MYPKARSIFVRGVLNPPPNFLEPEPQRKATFTTIRDVLDYGSSRISTKTRLFEAKVGMENKMGEKTTLSKSSPDVDFFV